MENNTNFNPTDQLKRLRGSESLKRIWGNNADEILEKHIEISKEVDRLISLDKDEPTDQG